MLEMLYSLLKLVQNLSLTQWKLRISFHVHSYHKCKCGSISQGPFHIICSYFILYLQVVREEMGGADHRNWLWSLALSLHTTIFYDVRTYMRCSHRANFQSPASLHHGFIIFHSAGSVLGVQTELQCETRMVPQRLHQSLQSPRRHYARRAFLH